MSGENTARRSRIASQRTPVPGGRKPFQSNSSDASRARATVTIPSASGVIR